MAKKERTPLFDTSEDITLRIQVELADKIGLNESIMLMQLEYLISISNHWIKERLWTYQSLEDLKKSFPWWSIATISRIIKSLQSQGIIFVDSFNKRKGDKTQWFALNLEKIAEIGCVKLNKSHPIFHFEKWSDEDKLKMSVEPDPILQIGDTIFHNEKPIFQNETTLPEITTKTTTKNNIAADAALLPDTKYSRLLFEKLALEFAAKGRRAPKKFPSLACKRKFDARAKYLNGNTATAIDRALEKGIMAVTGITDFIAKWNPPPAPVEEPKEIAVKIDKRTGVRL